MSATYALLEPSLRVLLLHFVLEAHSALAALPPCDTGTRAAHDDEEVHAENTDSWVVLDAEINVLLDTEAKVAGLGEVCLLELVLLHLETSLEAVCGGRVMQSVRLAGVVRCVVTK